MDAHFGSKSHEPRMLTVIEENSEALSRQLQSQLSISHENLVKFHNSYEKTTNYGVQNPVAIRPPDRGSFLRSPCLFMKYPKVKDPLVEGNDIAAEKS